MSRTVAVIGASSNRAKFGNKALRAFANQGYTVIPITPNEAEVEGYRTYPTVLDVPGAVARDLYGFDLILLRPDLHIAWRGNRLADAPENLAAMVTGCA